MVASIGVGIFQARPGRVSTRTGSPKRVTTTACPAPTETSEEATAAPNTIAPARVKRMTLRQRLGRAAAAAVALSIVVVASRRATARVPAAHPRSSEIVVVAVISAVCTAR